MRNGLERHEVSRVLAWLTERAMGPAGPDQCNRCGHGQHFHRHDDASDVEVTDPRATFRCVWPMPDGPAVQLCDCPDFIAANTVDEALLWQAREALRLTREYVWPDTRLPKIEGWSWWDAVVAVDERLGVEVGAGVMDDGPKTAVAPAPRQSWWRRFWPDSPT